MFLLNFSSLRQFPFAAALVCAGLVRPAWGEEAAPQNIVRDARIGACTHFAQDWDVEKVMPLVAQSGLGWIRDELYWGKLESTKGVYEVPEKTLTWINAAHAAGLKVLLIFNGSNNLYAPDIYNPDAYAAAAAATAKALAGKVQAIEILNEPQNFGFTRHYKGAWNGLEKDGTTSIWIGKYVELLNKAAKAIKLANPDIKVIGLGGVSPANYRELALGIAPEVDGIVDHPYSFRSVPEVLPFNSSDANLKRDGLVTGDITGSFASFVQMYRDQSAKYHGPKELWLTEWGWSTFQEKKPGGLYAGYTRSAQAKYTLRRLMQSVGLGVDLSFIYDFMDGNAGPFDQESNFGLVDPELKPKPAFEAVKRFVSAMADYRPRENFKITIFPVDNRPDTYPIVWDGGRVASSGNVVSYQFSDGKGNPMVALWSDERADGDFSPRLADVEIATPKPFLKVTAYDLLTGETSSLAFEDKPGRVVLRQMTVPDHPILLTFP